MFGSGGRHSASNSKGREPYREPEDTRYGAEGDGFSAEEYVSREERRASRKWVKKLLMGVALVLVALGACVAVFELWIKAPESDISGPNTYTPAPSDGNTILSPAVTEEPVGVEAPLVEKEKGRREGVYTFLIVGHDVASNSADTNIVCCFDTVNGKLNFLSIPRETLVNTSYSIKHLNYIYPACVNDGKDAVAAVNKAVADIMGYQVDHYAICDVDAVAKLVDIIGGVWFDVPCDMDWDSPDQGLSIHIKKGFQLLSGEDAVKVLRFRISNDGSNTYGGGDIDRIGVQQDLLMAMATQMLTLGNVPHLGELARVFVESVNTDITANNIGFLAQEFLKLDAEDITFTTMPGYYWGRLYGVGYCFIDLEEWMALLNASFNPYYQSITERNVNILTSDGLEFYSTQGYIAGGDYSFAGAQA